MIDGQNALAPKDPLVEIRVGLQFHLENEKSLKEFQREKN
jgi:hypothetical protein